MLSLHQKVYAQFLFGLHPISCLEFCLDFVPFFSSVPWLDWPWFEFALLKTTQDTQQQDLESGWIEEGFLKAFQSH